jgi:Plant transposon protein
MRLGKWPQRRPNAVLIGGERIDWNYYLCDGIYPRYLVLISSISKPRHLKEKTYAQQHEGVRKAIERVFGVLFKRFRILALPSRLWALEDMVATVHACCILHNMIVRERQNAYTGTRMTFDDFEDNYAGFESPSVQNDEGSGGNFFSESYVNMESREDNDRLKRALEDHIWERRGAQGTAARESDADDFD